jgi:hypothetical protein
LGANNCGGDGGTDKSREYAAMRKRRKKTKRKPDKIEDIDVQRVRKLCVLKYPQAEIASFFGVTQQLVSAICNRSKRVDVPYDPNVDISKFLQRKPMLKRGEVLRLLGLAPAPNGFVRRI